ncbi:discoidin domain-containing protein [uncultured Algibacter sp.]|uniref:discoidin domain-containing protein n=1 Tax=uncultured Algibacter sp. TaxID=298659 RepID=UPI00261F6941|nr:discoidin domain-containing protein [uncultured Algibacter sp.]
MMVNILKYIHKGLVICSLLLLVFGVFLFNSEDNNIDDGLLMSENEEEFVIEKAKERPKLKLTKEELAVAEGRKQRYKSNHLFSKTSLSSKIVNSSSTYANGSVTGNWSNVQFSAPNRFSTSYRTNESAYDREKDIFYVFTHAKHLFKIEKDETTYTNTKWTAMNIKQSFSGFFYNINPTPTTSRLLWSSEKKIKYSDDEGQTWNIPSGLSLNATSHEVAVSEVNGVNTIVVVGKVSGGAWKAFYSTDNGLSYNTSSFSLNNTSKLGILKPHNSEDLYLITRDWSADNIKTHKWNTTTNTFDERFSNDMETDPFKRVFGTVYNGNVHLYAAGDYQDVNTIYYSPDEGETWVTNTPTMTLSGDVVAREVHPTKPNVIFRGYLDHYYSTDSGANFNNTFAHKLGWDMKQMKVYKHKDGRYFMFTSNDFGCHISYSPDNKDSYISINHTSPTQMAYDSDNSQHYNTFFTATQDRGTRQMRETDGITGTGEIKSTDGLRVSLAGNERGVWTWMYYGTIFHRDNFGYKVSSNVSNSFSSSTWWAAPMIPSPNQKEDAVYIPSGSKLSKLTYNSYAASIIKTQHYFDFSTLTTQSLTGFGYSSLNTNKWFVSVKNGDFYYSEDGGATFSKASFSTTKPRANDLSNNYQKNQHVIKGSKLDENKVFYAGVGNIFMISEDGGKTFTNHNTGLSIYRMRSFDESPDGKYIFAACGTGGPWVFDVDADRWYEMNDENVPELDYTNVEYITRTNTVRFATYGFGVLNFKLDVVPNIMPPTKLAITAESSSGVDLQWEDNVSNETGFDIERSEDGVNFMVIGSVGSDVVSYTDTSISGLDEIFYRVKAKGTGDIVSEYSNYVVSSDGAGRTLPDRSGWELLSTDSNRPDHPGTHTFDGDINTYWFTDWGDNTSTHPHEIIIDMHETIDIKALGFYNRQDHPNGRVASYEFYASTDLNDWGTPVSQGTWTSTLDEIIESFPAKTARYLKFVALSNTGEGTNSKLTSCAELSVYTEVPDVTPPSPPRAPEIIQSGLLNTSTGEILWIDASNDENGFYVEKLVSGTYQRVATLSADTESIELPGLETASIHTYRIAAFNDIGVSEYSDLAKIYTAGYSLSTDDNTLNQTKVSLYPNPVKGSVINIKGVNELTSVKVFNLLGQEFPVAINNHNSVNVESLEKGSYFLIINNQFSLKLIKL